MKDNFSRIKKLKGETFAKTLRDAEGGILSLKDLPEIIRYAGTDAKPLIPYLRQKVLEALDTQRVSTNIYAPWKEMLNDAGYAVHVVKKGKERHSQDEFARYYREGELLCSFGGSAWDWTLIFFVVRHDADTVQPSENPDREDAYSTSVLRVKVSHNAVSISSRYNHTVSNPDATFRCNLNMLAPNLAEAISQQEGLDLSGRNNPLPDGFEVSADGHILRYEYELGGALIGDDAYMLAGVLYPMKDGDRIVEGCILRNSDCSLLPICEGSDEQNLSPAWETNRAEMLKKGWKLYQTTPGTVVAARGEERDTLMECVPCVSGR